MYYSSEYFLALANDVIFLPFSFLYIYRINMEKTK